MNELRDLNQLPTGFSVRAPRPDDADAIAAVINAESINESAPGDSDADDVSGDWQRVGIDPALDAWVVCTPAGEIVGYECIFVARDDGLFDIDGYVHPKYKNTGIGTYLLRRAEARVRQRTSELPSSVRIRMEATTFGTNTLSQQLFEAEGYALVRHFWRMEIDLESLPAMQILPDGITIRTAIVGQDEVDIYQTVQDSFADHWGFAPISYENWQRGRFEAGRFDPSLWFVAMDGTTIAGVALCRVRSNQSGWINTVGVRRQYRKRGIASALLREAFGEFYRRGHTNIGLGVDAQSLTGATRVYENVGMHVTSHFNTYEKTIRPGERAEQPINSALNN